MFRVNWKLEIAIQIAEGINNLQKKDVIHRDIKPGNVLLRWDHEFDKIDCVLCDLGIAVKAHSYPSQTETIEVPVTKVYNTMS